MDLTPKQVEINRLLGGPQRHSLVYGGSRSGKTFVLVRAVVIRAIKAAGSRHLITRFHANAVRSSIVLDTLPAVFRLCWPEVWKRCKEYRQDGFMELPNEAQLWFGGLDDKDRTEKILGNEYATVLFNECSQIPYSSVLIALTRLAQSTDSLRQRALYDLNPVGTNHWTYRLFIEHKEPNSMESLPNPDDYRFGVMNPGDNAANLDPEYLESLQALPERQRRRFFDGQYVAEIDGALWTLEGIERGRVTWDDVPELVRVVVAVDPSGAQSAQQTSSDMIGIVAMGLGTDGDGYVLADRTLRDSPARWARAAVNLYHDEDHPADRVIAEANFGGAMVEHTIRTADPNVPVRMVTASRGKSLRAEPVAALYEAVQDRPPRVHHVGRFPELEDEMANFSVYGYHGDRSPNRADALVMAATDLMLGKRKQRPKLHLAGEQIKGAHVNG